MEGEKEGVIPAKDVRRAMVFVALSSLLLSFLPFYTHSYAIYVVPIVLTPVNPNSALGIPPTKPELKEFLEILDPDDEGYASYEPFVAICALKLHARADSGGPAADEVDEAFRLFTGGSGGDDATLTLAHLKRVAMTLKQDVDEQLLKDMILEANGGAGVGKGVGRAEFEDVMRRAGAWK